MAGEDLASWRHVERLPSPAIHAGLRPTGKVVRCDVVDENAGLQLLPDAGDRGVGLLDLLRCRQKRRAVGQCPAVILRVRHLDAPGADPMGRDDHVGDTADIEPVDHDVDRQWKPQIFDCARRFPFPLVSAMQT